MKNKNRILPCLILACALSGCGVEGLTTAATLAKTQQEAAKAALQKKDAVMKGLDAAQQQTMDAAKAREEKMQEENK